MDTFFFFFFFGGPNCPLNSNAVWGQIKKSENLNDIYIKGQCGPKVKKFRGEGKIMPPLTGPTRIKVAKANLV